MFGRKKRSQVTAVDRDAPELMWLTVKDADEAWAVLQWVLKRVSVKAEQFWGGSRSVRVLRVGDWSATIHADGSRTEHEPSYKVEFPREIWDRALNAYTYAGAERKLRNEIFGKGKH
jgi:hypothetical protein